MIYYLPSCNFTAAHKDDSMKIRAWMKEHGVTVAGCCRPTQNLLKEGDLVLHNCTSCNLITLEASPRADQMSVYEYLLNEASFPWPDFHGEEITVQDCWRARNNMNEMKAVRECLKRMNMVPVELENNYEKTAFDGPFLYTPVSQANLKIAPKTYGKIAEEITPLPKEDIAGIMKEWVKQYTTERTAVYCNACLRGIEMTDAKGVHLLSLMIENL